MLLLMYFGGGVNPVADEVEQFGDNLEKEKRVGQLHGVVAVGGVASLCAGPLRVSEVLRGLNLLFSAFSFFLLPCRRWRKVHVINIGFSVLASLYFFSFFG